MAAMSLNDAPQPGQWVRCALLLVRGVADHYVAYRLRLVLTAVERARTHSCRLQIAFARPTPRQ